MSDRQTLQMMIAVGVYLGLMAASLTSSQAAAAHRANSSVSSGSPTETQSSKTLRPKLPNFLGELASSDARLIVNWVFDTGDNGGLPFVIVDKKNAKVFVFDGRGGLLGAAPALLGLAPGDDATPGIGDRKLSDIRPEERTTPAGRFVADLGPNLRKQDVLWIDYNAALALHPVLPEKSRERRLERAAVPSPLYKRVSFGCVEVSLKFYNSVVHPTFKDLSGIVYILPEVKSIPDVFFAATREFPV